MYEIYAGNTVLGRIRNLEDARDFRDMMERKLRGQGFKAPRYPDNRIVKVRYER